MNEDMNQLEFKYLLLSQLSNYEEIKELLNNGETEKALKKLESFKNVIAETLNKN